MPRTGDQSGGEDNATPDRAAGREEVEEGAPAWVVTFADLMSLLLCFFVLLLSFSRMDNERFKELAGSLREAFGVQRQIPAFDLPRGIDMIARDFNTNFTADLLRKIRSAVKVCEKSKGIRVSQDARGVLISLPGAALFESGSSRLREQGRQILGALLPFVSQAPGEVHVEGHTDSIPFRGRRPGLADGNWELSYERALAVVRFFAGEGRIPISRLVPIGRGPSKPVASNLTPWGRARNRRVEISLLRSLSEVGKRGPSSPALAIRPPAGGREPDLLVPEARFPLDRRSVARGPASLFPAE